MAEESMDEDGTSPEQDVSQTYSRWGGKPRGHLTRGYKKILFLGRGPTQHVRTNNPPLSHTLGSGLVELKSLWPLEGLNVWAVL